MMLEVLLKQTIAGQKTQTRRTGELGDGLNAKVSDIDGEEIKVKFSINSDPDKWALLGPVVDGKAMFYDVDKDTGDKGHVASAKSRLNIGETVFVKEPWKAGPNGETIYPYLSDTQFPANSRFNNKMFMPLEKARYFIKITGIRVERLLSISNADCYAEGIERDHSLWKDYITKKPFKAAKTPQESFFSLFKKANNLKEKDPIKNIWVFVYEYELTTKNNEVNIRPAEGS